MGSRVILVYLRSSPAEPTNKVGVLHGGRELVLAASSSSHNVAAGPSDNLRACIGCTSEGRGQWIDSACIIIIIIIIILACSTPSPVSRTRPSTTKNIITTLLPAIVSLTVRSTHLATESVGIYIGRHQSTADISSMQGFSQQSCFDGDVSSRHRPRSTPPCTRRIVGGLFSLWAVD